MRLALEEAKAAETRDEVPIGAIIIDKDGNVMAKAGNRTREMHDPCAHAEILAIRQACQNTGTQRIPNTTLYVTLEPCAMCAAAISFARISHIVIGAIDQKGGGIFHGGQFYTQPTCHHKPTTAHGLYADECGGILKSFFREKRKR